MKKGKAPGPSGVVTEILKKAFSDVCSKMIVDLTNSIIRDNTMQGRIQSFFGDTVLRTYRSSFFLADTVIACE